MHHYRYKAFNEEGRYVNGKVMAENPGELAAFLRVSQLELVSFKEEKPSSISFLGSIKAKDLIGIFVHLEQLERAGVSIIDSINDLKENGDSQKVKNLMHEVHESIKNGSLLSESLAKRPDIFNNTYIGLISMGEKTGNLATALSSIIEDIKWNIDIRRKTKKAIMGPLFGIFMMFVVLGVMTTIVVPKVTAFLKAQDIALPAVTVALIAFSDFMQSYWYIIIFSIPVIWITFKLLARVEELGVKLDHFKLKIPVIGTVANKIDAAKFCQFFAMTFKSGLGVLECLDAAGAVVKNKAIKRSILIVRQQVSDGQSLAKSIAATGYFPNLVIRMFKVGEESGNMESALQNIKFFYDREINDSIDRLVSMIQPTITLVMGGMIAWITIAVFGPIYGTFSKIG
jgi:type IV pilus assembly protein PilC